MTFNARTLPQSKSYRTFSCGDPDCGPHIVLYSADDKPIAQMVLHKAHAIRLAEQMIEFVVNKGELS